ncbi:MAG: cation diffusion facilitator family transporter [Verrucomicrobiales bacterium]
MNGALGWHLLRLGKRRNSIVLEANGHHVLTDCYTSFGVAAGLVLAWLTGWKKWDAICAIAVAGNMIWAARSLLSRSIHGLMDHADPALRSRLEEILARSCGARGVAFHALRFRSLGDALWADVHLTLPGKTLLRDAARQGDRDRARGQRGIRPVGLPDDPSSSPPRTTRKSTAKKCREPPPLAGTADD